MNRKDRGKERDMKNQTVARPLPAKRNEKLSSYLKRNWTLYTMLLPGLVLLFIFSYIPMYGIVMAFQQFKPAVGFFKSPFVDPWYFYFTQLFQDPYFYRIFTNTLLLGIFTLLWSFPAPILLALMFNELKSKKFKRVSQTISYMPYFLSTVVVIGLMKILFATNGPIDAIVANMGGSMKNIFLQPGLFRTIYIASGLWANMGYNSIIYLAAISGINAELYEAAKIDSANRFQQIIHITIPSIMPTIIILLIFSVSGIVGNDYQKILLIYSEATYKTADVIGTYVYRVGIEKGSSQSYAAAAGLFTSVLSFVLLAATNFVAKKAGETSLW